MTDDHECLAQSQESQPKAKRKYTSGLIRAEVVRRFAHERDKEAGTVFLAWLNREVFALLNRAIHASGQHRRLSAEDAEAYEKLLRRS